MALSKKTRKLIIQFAEYMVGGGVWFWSGYLIIVGISVYWKPFNNPDVDLFVANFVGNAVGITLNFIIQKYWAFRTKHAEKIAFTAKRYVIYTVINAFGLNFLLLKFMQDWFGIDVRISQFIASGFFTFWNYYWYKVWVFPEGSQHRDKVEKPKLRKAHKHITSAHQ